MMKHIIPTMLLCVCAIMTGCAGAEGGGGAVKGAEMVPVLQARILPDAADVARAEGVAVERAGELRVGEDGALAFGKGGRLLWESESLLRGPRGAVVLDSNYSTTTAYHKDEPLLLVSDAAGQAVLRVTIGRVMFKVARPPEEFEIDLYLNESEGGWMRTVIDWEGLADGRVYLRATVNGRPYCKLIAPGFPAGPLKFMVGPENVKVREVAFYDAPLPREPFAHLCRGPLAVAANEPARRAGFITEAEQAALNARGGVVVYVPDGALTYGLEVGLRTMGLRGFRVVSGGGAPQALERAAVLVLPDNDRWPEGAKLDNAISRYVRGGGGVLAVGKGALEARRLGLCAFTPRHAGVDGATQEFFTRRGPFYAPPLSQGAEVVMKESLTGLPCALTTPCGEGRVALTAAMPFGYYFWNPTYEIVAGVGRNAARYAFLKKLLLYSAGVAAPTPDATPLQSPVAEKTDWSILTATRGTKLTTGDEPVTVDEYAGLDLGRALLGGEGALAFWLRADTLNLTGVEPRSLFRLSDGGRNSLHLYYDPCDQFLVLRSATPNEEGILYANERTTWDGRAWRHIAFTWAATATGDAAVELFIDGRSAARGGLPLPTKPWATLAAGGTPGMRGLPMSLRDAALLRGPGIDLASVRAKAAPPISWEDTPEDRARLDAFLRGKKLAILGETHRGHWQAFRTHDQYGLSFDVLLEKDLLDGRFEQGGYSVLWAPGGGPPKYQEPLAMRDRIRAVLREGCGYVGVCAGLIESSSGDPAQKLALFKTPIVGFGGTQLVDVCLGGTHPTAKGIAGAFTDEEGQPAVRFVHMGGPPLRVREPGADVAGATAMGMAPDLAASGSFRFGKGRGLVWAPHPELTAWAWWRPSDRTRYVMRRLFVESLYAAGPGE